MEFLVCISKAPDTTTRIAFSEGDTRFNEDGVQFIVNPYDEWYALVRALELVEAGGGKVVIASVGGADVDPILRKALAIGAHEAVRIDADPRDAGQVAAELAAYAKDKGFDAILCDIKLPDLRGPEFFERLKEFAPEKAARVIFATGDVVNDSTRAFLASSSNPALIKPFQVEDLQQAIATVVGR